MRYKCICEYDGRNFSGWQRQPKARTVQAEIETTLRQIYKDPIVIHGASRTDKGVHATDQVFHYDSPVEIPVERLAKVISSQLPSDIAITEVVAVDEDFHARYSCLGKTYVYRVQQAQRANVFEAAYLYHYGRQVDLSRVVECAKVLVGTHDFKGFMASGSDKENTVRTIYSIDFQLVGDVLEMRISGSGFLYNMVRIIMGTLLNVSEGKLDKERVKLALEVGDRNVFKRTAPANGLYLVQTRYGEITEKKLDERP